MSNGRSIVRTHRSKEPIDWEQIIKDEDTKATLIRCGYCDKVHDISYRCHKPDGEINA